MPRKRPPTRISPAALVLLESGVTQAEIASVLGCTPSNVGHQLRGFSRPQPGLIAAIRLKAGEHAAARIARILNVEQVAS